MDTLREYVMLLLTVVLFVTFHVFRAFCWALRDLMSKMAPGFTFRILLPLIFVYTRDLIPPPTRSPHHGPNDVAVDSHRMWFVFRSARFTKATGRLICVDIGNEQLSATLAKINNLNVKKKKKTFLTKRLHTPVLLLNSFLLHPIINQLCQYVCYVNHINKLFFFYR